MHVSPYRNVNDLLATFLVQLKASLDDNLVGLYLYGSLVSEDFDMEISDIDLLAVTSTGITDKEFKKIKKIQDDLVLEHKQWIDRLEVAYLSRSALKTFKTQKSKIAIISPGEPFHFKEAGNDWLINWYSVREKGIVLFGPPTDEIIAPVSKDEFIAGVKRQVADWRDWIKESKAPQSRKYQAYAILTMCRALYTCRHGDQPSKKQAALWTKKELPTWSSLIDNALKWREAWRDERIDHAATFPDTLRFVNFVIDKILS
jgi:predicted nucleotidyltransferase